MSTMRESRILVVLDCRNFEEVKSRRDLIHDGGKLLKHMLDRISIPRDSWEHTYIYSRTKNNIPTKKLDRWNFLNAGMLDLRYQISNYQPTEIVAMGGLACEILTGASRVSDREGTCWKFRREWQDLELKRVWVSYAPDAALFEPGLMCNIIGVLATAGKAAGLNVRPKPLNETLVFDWTEYI